MVSVGHAMICHAKPCILCRVLMGNKMRLGMDDGDPRVYEEDLFRRNLFMSVSHVR